jgi:membrane protein
VHRPGATDDDRRRDQRTRAPAEQPAAAEHQGGQVDQAVAGWHVGGDVVEPVRVRLEERREGVLHGRRDGDDHERLHPHQRRLPGQQPAEQPPGGDPEGDLLDEGAAAVAPQDDADPRDDDGGHREVGVRRGTAQGRHSHPGSLPGRRPPGLAPAGSLRISVAGGLITLTRGNGYVMDTRTNTDDTGTRGATGEEAGSPQEIPAKGWLQITKRAFKEASKDQVPLLAAGVAFYAFLSLFPAMIATVMVYGLLFDPRQVEQQVQSVAGALPTEARDLLLSQLQSITETNQQALGVGLVIAVAAALWSASAGTGNLITAVNIAYDEDETRGFLKRKGLALLLTLGAIVFVVVAVALVAVAPVVLGQVVGGGPLRWLLEAARWVGLLVAVTVALAIIFRLAPDRDAPRMKWVSVGAAVATLLWLVASLGFSLYVNNFGSYAETYGAMAGVVVLLLWLWLTCYMVLLGAEINAESEQQTARDTTKGEERPLGQRGAVKADTPPQQG